MTDLHVHSEHSGDSRTPMRDMCLAAVDAGLTAVAFTEHVDFAPSKWSNASFDYGAWMRDIGKTREEFAGRLEIRAGAEVDYQPEYHAETEAFLAAHPFDYVLGSVHYGRGVILEEHGKYFAGTAARDAYATYFENVLAAVGSGLFETVAHLDLCKRYGVEYYGAFRLDEYCDLLEPVLKAMIDRGTALEINTAGLRQPPGETYPGMDTVTLYAALGGMLVTIGSDAHRPHQLAAGFEQILPELSRLGLCLR